MVLKGSSAGPIIRLNARVTPIAAANSANDEIGGLIVGTSVHQGTAANSLVLSNIDDDGDIQMLVNDGGHSKEFLLANGDTADLQLGHGMATATVKTASGDLTLSPGGSLQVTEDTFSAATKHLVVGHTATVTGTHAATFEILGTGLGSAQANIGVWSADEYGPAVTFIKSRHASIGSNAIVQDNDLVGRMIYLPDDGTDFATRAAQFHAEVDDASPEAGGVGMAFVWSQMPGGGTDAMAETMRLSAAGTLFVGDNSNVGMTTGLTINQGAADNEAFALKSSDVAHGMTTRAETDTYFSISKYDANGGVMSRAMTDTGTVGWLLRAHAPSVDSTKDTNGTGFFMVDTRKNSGSGDAAPDADSNLVVFTARGTAKFIFDMEGQGHSVLAWTTFDAHDDIAVINDLENEMLEFDGSPERTKRRHMLEEMGVIGKDSWHIENGRPKAMVNQSKLQMLHHGALMQVGERITALEEENTKMKALVEAIGA